MKRVMIRFELNARRSGLCAAMLCTALLNLGCDLIPPNNLRLITAEPAGKHPKLIHFDNGTFLAKDDAGVAMIAGKSAVALFDYRGPTNRFDLLLTRGSDRALYERIGQYGPLQAARTKAAPIGVRSALRGKQLRGAIDVFVARSEREDPGTSFEHFPRAMRIVGYFVVPMIDPPPDPHPLASLLTTAQSDGAAAYPDLYTLTAGPQPDQLPPILADLPKLPLIDVEYLVPTALTTAFHPQNP